MIDPIDATRVFNRDGAAAGDDCEKTPARTE